MGMNVRRVGLVLLAVGLVLRLAYAGYGHRHGGIPTNSDGYETIALNLLSGNGYAIKPGIPTAQREPVYPLFIAACYLLGRRPWLVLFLQCLLSTASAWLAGRLARRLGGERAGLAALAVCALHPQLIYYCAYFFRETILVFLFAVLCLASADWAAATDDPAGERGARLGGWAAAGLGLANSAHLPAMALSGAALWLAAPAKSRTRRAVLFCMPLAIAFGFWSARNAATFGRFVPGSTHGGEEFYQALIVPPSDLGTMRQTEILSADATFQAASSLTEVERASVLARAGLVWISARPVEYACRVAAGVFKFWRPWPYRRIYNHSYATLFVASLLSDAWLIPLGLFGLWFLRARWREAPAVWAGAIGLTVIYGAVHAVIRYRLPLIVPLAVVAFGALYVRDEKGAHD